MFRVIMVTVVTYAVILIVTLTVVKIVAITVKTHTAVRITTVPCTAYDLHKKWPNP